MQKYDGMNFFDDMAASFDRNKVIEISWFGGDGLTMHLACYDDARDIRLNVSRSFLEEALKEIAKKSEGDTFQKYEGMKPLELKKDAGHGS